MPPVANDLPEPPEHPTRPIVSARQTFQRASEAVDQALEDGHLRAAQRANGSARRWLG